MKFKEYILPAIAVILAVIAIGLSFTSCIKGLV